MSALLAYGSTYPGPTALPSLLQGNFNADCDGQMGLLYLAGNAISQDSFVSLVPTSAPNCGVNLLGYLEVNACTEISVTSQVSFSGNLFKRGVKRFAKAGEQVPKAGPLGQPLFDDQGIVIRPAQYEPAPAYIKTAQEQLEEAKFNQLTPEEKAKIKRPATPKPGVESNRLVTSEQGSSLQLVATGDCQLALLGDFQGQACEDFTASSTLKISGKAVTVKKPLNIISTGEPNCGLTLEGELEIDACKETTITASASGGKIKIINCYGLSVGEVDLSPKIKVTKDKKKVSI